ncbi:MAG TPA: hypothetical protein ENH41_02790 [Candidatus Omnitrophica bacterium]|nr:hypothetical protein [Candidatus Omnitrophota bacterium]
MYIKLISVLVILGCFCRISVAEELIQAPAAIHISSTVSDGKLSIPEIIATAKENGIKVIIFTDHAMVKWEYGLWPLRKIIKKTVERNSISTYGIKRYLREIEDAQKKNPDLVLIPALESAPFYYWSGNPFKNNLKLHNWHKHILVIGLGKAEDYKNIPSVSNGNSLYLRFRIWLLWPILTLLAGVFCLRKRQFGYKDLQGRSLGPYSLKWRIFGIVVIIFSLLFLFNNFPFAEFKFDQYHGEQGVGPYQNLVDYVNNKGGLTFWAHPEAEYIKRIGRVEVETREYSDYLLDTSDYSGFAVFTEGYKIGRPGNIWDSVLKQYCLGERKSPVWAISELDFDVTGDLAEYIKGLRTVILVPSLTREAVLEALGHGRMYVVRGKPGLVLDKFVIHDSLSDVNVTMGDKIELSGNPVVKMGGHFPDKRSKRVKINLIRNGVVTKTFEVMSPFEIDYQDDYFDKGKKIYYRIEIRYAGGILATNPVFVKFGN